jgi:prepilin-type N-terminal cleavage/methylation domain-containing protein
MAKTIKKQKGFTLIELLVVMGILAVLLAAVLIAINPDRQFKQARDSQRRSDVLTILNAVQQNMADNKGVLPSGIPTKNLTATPPVLAAEISNAGANLCGVLMPTYVSILPSDPTLDTNITNCTTYSTGYNISKDSAGRVTVETVSEVDGSVISVTR